MGWYRWLGLVYACLLPLPRTYTFQPPFPFILSLRCVCIPSLLPSAPSSCFQLCCCSALSPCWSGNPRFRARFLLSFEGPESGDVAGLAARLTELETSPKPKQRSPKQPHPQPSPAKAKLVTGEDASLEAALGATSLAEQVQPLRQLIDEVAGDGGKLAAAQAFAQIFPSITAGALKEGAERMKKAIAGAKGNAGGINQGLAALALQPVKAGTTPAELQQQLLTGQKPSLLATVLKAELPSVSKALEESQLGSMLSIGEGGQVSWQEPPSVSQLQAAAQAGFAANGSSSCMDLKRATAKICDSTIALWSEAKKLHQSGQVEQALVLMAQALAISVDFHRDFAPLADALGFEDAVAMAQQRGSGCGISRQQLDLLCSLAREGHLQKAMGKLLVSMGFQRGRAGGDATAGAAAPPPSKPPASKPICTFCKKEGHKEERCYKKKAQEKKAAEQAPASS